MTTKNIQNVVAEFFKQQNDIWKSEAGYSIAECKIKEKELLTQLVKEVEAGATHSALQEIMDDVSMLHQRKELDDNGFCTIRDLLHSKAVLHNE